MNGINRNIGFNCFNDDSFHIGLAREPLESFKKYRVMGDNEIAIFSNRLIHHSFSAIQRYQNTLNGIVYISCYKAAVVIVFLQTSGGKTF